jgi:hypothetical protein
VKEYLATLDDTAWGAASDVVPKFVSPSDPAAQWTGAHKGLAFFAYSDNYLIDVKYGVIVDVEASRAIRQAEVGAAKTMIERTEERFGLKPERLAGDTAYGSGANRGAGHNRSDGRACRSVLRGAAIGRATGEIQTAQGLRRHLQNQVGQLPNVESLVEVLGPKLEILYWQAMYTPAGTPEAVIKTLNAAMQEAVSEPTIIKAWDAEGFFIYPKEMRTPAAANALLKSEIVRWGQVIRDNNIHVDQ